MAGREFRPGLTIKRTGGRKVTIFFTKIFKKRLLWGEKENELSDKKYN